MRMIRFVLRYGSKGYSSDLDPEDSDPEEATLMSYDDDTTEPRW